MKSAMLIAGGSLLPACEIAIAPPRLVWSVFRILARVSIARQDLSAQSVPGIARDALIALRQRDQFLAADDVVDGGKGLVLGAQEHLAQDRIRRVGAVGQDH